MEKHMENGNPEFVAEIKKAIDAAFQKDPVLSEFKIEYKEGGKIHPSYIAPKEPNSVWVFIDRIFDGCEHQYQIQTFIYEYHLSVICLFEESFSENLKNAVSTSEWLPHINECYICTTVTFK